MGAIRDDLLEIYGRRAHKRYGLTDVTQLQHALQAAANAEGAGEGPALVLASLLHDVGHMIHDLGEDPASAGIDDRHEALGAKWLAARFADEVSEPVRLHVAAKRYLVATEPDYAAKLSGDSVLSLRLQGGPMTPAEVEAFRANRWADAAVQLRRIDEGAKDPRAQTPDFDHFLRYAELCVRA